MPIDEVEDKIARWSGVETEAMVEKVERELILKQLRASNERKVDFFARLNGESEVIPEEAVKLEEIINKKEEQKKEEVLEKEKELVKKNEIVNVVTCDSCGQKTKINFNPNPNKPLFCKECLKEFRRKQALEENAKKGLVK
jgi:CxxC-x17-CxxC domain-containing protein